MEVIAVTGSHKMKNGQIYVCEGCGLELKVVKESRECATPSEECECEPRTFVCCGNELKLKE